MQELRAWILAVVIGAVACAPAAAQSAAPHYDLTWHGSILAGAVLGSGLIVLAERNDTATCRWCGVDAQGRPSVPGIDDWGHAHLAWHNEERATALSHLTAGASLAWPLAGLTSVHRGFGGDWKRDELVVLESIAVAQFASDLSKRAFLRARPHVVFDGAAAQRLDDVHSYMSGHTATSFAAVISTATIASRRGSRHAKWIWIGGLGLAGTTGYLRVGANRHFLTDVLTGAAVGSAVGALLPRSFDGDSDSSSVATASLLALPIAGIGPAARLGPHETGEVRLRFGAGARSLGVLGSINLK